MATTETLQVEAGPASFFSLLDLRLDFATMPWSTPLPCMNLRLFFPALLSTCLSLAAQEKPAGALEQLPVGRADPLPDHTLTLGKKAADAFAKRDWDTARTAYQEMLKLEENNALAWANLGAVEQQAGRTREAVECFEKSVRVNPNLAQSWNALGLIHSAKGDTYLAISSFTRAIHEDPTDARAHNYLAIAMQSFGWNAAAEAELQRAIELKPDYGIAYFNMALLYADQKPPSIALAKRAYARALALGVEKDEVLERRLKE
jgi:tetratricopeptide (TPR) repeat protein